MYNHQVFKEKRPKPASKNFDLPKGPSNKDKILENIRKPSNTDKYINMINNARQSLKSRQEKLDEAGHPHSYFSPRGDPDFVTPYSKLSDYVQPGGKKKTKTINSSLWKYKDPALEPLA